MKHTVFRFLEAIFFLVISSALVAYASEYRINSRIVPPQHQKAFEFFELIKFPVKPKGMFKSSNAPKWNIEKIMGYISDEGIIFKDVNNRMVGSKSKNQIKESLSNRTGDIFNSFAHLSHIYSIPYKQYSELKFTDLKNGVKIDVAQWYSLTFKYQKGEVTIINWDYNQIEGD